MDFFTALLDNPLPDKRIIETVSTSGAGSGFYADEHIQVLLTAMQTKDYGRVLARPKLLVNDNEEGIIKAETITTVVSPKSQVVPGTGISQSTQATSVELSTYTEGITLTITPHISKGDQLRLNIAVTRTDFGLRPDYVLNTPAGELTGPTPPDLLTSDVTSTVTVPDKSTIILGGLEKLKQTKGGTKVPILGDIPLIGGLFRSTANKDTQSRLYVFVKANILRPGEESAGISDLEVVSLKNRATFEKFEEEMQGYEDWPGIKPKPMDPLKILEADEDEAVSLRDRSVFEKPKKAMQEGKGLPGTKSKVMHPMRVLELN
jgi:general secretion pathway protein D